MPDASHSQSDPQDLLEDVLKAAKSHGADAADAIFAEGTSSSLSVRFGEAEDLERSEGADLGLRVLIGKRQACVSTSDTSAPAIEQLVERAIAMAKAVPEDAYAGLADPDQLATDVPTLDEYDASEVSAEKMIEMARACEDAARSINGVKNSEGAEMGFGKSTVYLAATNGFTGMRQSSRFSLSCSVVAGEGTGMERDYDYASAVYLSDLPDPETIGKNAGTYAVRLLNPRKKESGQVPIVYDTRVSSSLVRHLTSAVNGASVARGTTFLKDSMGAKIFAEGIDIVDDPHRKRGLGSKPFDAEGIATQKRNIVDNGILSTWILDLATSRQLGLETTGHAARGTGSPPSPSATNVHIAPGTASQEELISDIKEGLYVRELIGMGINGVTGDYSRGAGGFWIENGEITYPVNEITIAGNLKDMYLNLTPANDLEFKWSVNAPTLRVEGMTLAGT